MNKRFLKVLLLVPLFILSSCSISMPLNHMTQGELTGTTISIPENTTDPIVINTLSETSETTSEITTMTTTISNSLCTVTFYTDGEVYKTSTTSKGKTVSQPENPKKTGYTFSGWYLDENYSTSFKFSTPISEDITLYAKFTPSTKISVTVYDADDASQPWVFLLTYGGNLQSFVSALEKEGKTFKGLYYDKTCKQAYTISSPVTAPLTLYAKFE